METKEMKYTAWLITAKTNLHVGDECATGYGIIDKSVQRNPITELPCINSSSLKGALNEFFCHNTDFNGEKLLNIFGSDKKTKTPSQKGNAIFFDANLLAFPKQSDSTLYELVSTIDVIERAKAQLETFKVKMDDFPTYKTQDENGKINLAELCSDEGLPIIARNRLENGESQNLWYEQVVPQETVFYTLMKVDEEFAEKLDKQIVQIGANATIGYGYCEFKKLG